METAFPITLDLLVAIGLYALAAGVGGVLAPERWRGMILEFDRPLLTYIAGFAVFAVGAAIVMVHNIWADPLAVIVSLCGWGAAIEGLVLIAYPAPLIGLARAFIDSLRIWAFISVFIGAALIAIGLTGHANPIIFV